ncbi:MAG TPA: hypothetical protein PK610_13115, partial [Flavobacteriales bacterium]|nr:hypothetical protein [Flavobacteriales bacterium]
VQTSQGGVAPCRGVVTNESEIKAFSEKLHLISEEMDAFLRELNEMYLKKKEENELKLEIDNGIDNRSSLFNRFQE